MGQKMWLSGASYIRVQKFLRLDPEKEVLLDVSSTSSESDADYATPLQELRTQELKKKLSKSSNEKKSKKRKRYSSSESENSASECEKEAGTSQKKRKHLKKNKK